MGDQVLCLERAFPDFSKTSLHFNSKQPFAFTTFSDNAAIEGEGGNVIMVNLQWDRLRLVTLLGREEEEEGV